ncbi:septum site-determining protein MinC [Cyanobium sp. Alchichica 3B3-8F6]|uniref:septum site-determining protein MinC n=1 Tax=Cyanobium sp. Alchichica 3B3-8F6 TaxID=2823696 RepID=UPI0020CF349D|nr:septum site-determining protein MinC [Cyanobium sp. Alchichica 3B3-8F6]
MEPAGGAVFTADRSGQGAHRLVLPAPQVDAALATTALGGAANLVRSAVESAALLADGPVQGAVMLDARSWRLGLSQLSEIQATLASRQLQLVALTSGHPHTHVAAAGLGLESHWPHPPGNGNGAAREAPASASEAGLLVHQGTLRSGDHLQADGTVLLLGDVNPGARISAGGHVLVWGRLRGIAHAGCTGNSEARIVALQLRPLQLRIAAAVARGPEGLPPAGLAEEARIVDGAIQIDPAQPTWPLSG